MDPSIKSHNKKVGRLGRARTALIAIIVVIAFIGAMVLLYSLITDRIIYSSLRASEELARHDEASIAASLDYRWDELEGIGAECRQAKSSSISDLLGLLQVKKQNINCLDLGLLGSDEKFYFSSLLVESEPGLLALCEQNGDRFAEPYDPSLRKSAESQMKTLVFGVKITPFTVADVEFSEIVCRFSSGTLSKELKIDSYDGQGYSSVITRNGDYIISTEQSAGVMDVQNFFESLQSSRIENGVTIDQIRQDIEDDKAFHISVNDKGQTVIMQFTPMQNTNWYFITSVPRSVFEQQSLEILQIVLAITAILFVALAIVALLAFRNRQAAARAKIEEAHSEELSHALDLAEQANRAKTTFLSSMSHDIRTPMNAIIGFTTLASARLEEPDRLKDYLDKISKSSNHLLALINDVLDMSRIESGKVTIEESPQDLDAMLEEIRHIIQPEADKRGQNLKFVFDGDAETMVHVDRLRLNQVLLNLLSNAVKFTPDGGDITVTMEQIEQGEGTGTYRLSVSDTGIGMSPEFAATVFESFTREETATVSGIQGTGLGMAITKNIIDLMGGTIVVESTPGEGTTFTATFTLRQQDESEKALAKASASESADESKDPFERLGIDRSFEGMRLLLVDDNDLSRELAKEILEEAGFEVETAEDGAKEVEAVKNSPHGYFDAVLSDVQMPVMNGHDAARAIRRLEDPKLASIPIIALTANAFEEDAVAAMEAGMNAHMGKPIDIPTLMETLNRILKYQDDRSTKLN